MRTKFLIALAIATALAAAFASNALAADVLQTSPAVLQHVGFENTTDTLAVYPYQLGDSTPASATWGPVTTRFQLGSHGFWCAGSVPSDWPNYPSPTRGQAVFSANDTSQYAQSWIQYSYIEPSWGALENINPFRVDWMSGSLPPTSPVTFQYTNPFLPQSPVWTTLRVSRNQVGLSTAPGYFRFNFYTSTGDTATAEGATVDDVESIGYKYGPATNIIAARGTSPHSSVTISWTAAASPSGGTPYYDVWRHDVAANTWTLVTAARTSSLTCVDTSASVNKTYEYGIQAWDGAISTSDWGPLATSAQVAPVPATSITDAFNGSQTATTAPYGAALRITGTLADVDGVPAGGQAAEMFVLTSPDNSAWTTASPSVATSPIETSPGSYTATLTVSAAVYCKLSFAGANGYSASRGTSLSVTKRAATTSWSGTGLTVATPKYGAATSYFGTLQSESGSMPGKAGQIVLQTSTNGSSWATSSTAVVSETAPSVYSANLTITQAIYCRFAYAGDTNYAPANSATYGPINFSQNTEVSFNTVTIASLTPGFPGTVAVGANLYCENGPVVGRTTVVVKRIYGGLVDATTPATENSPGHYTANVPVETTHGFSDALQYEFYFAGDPGYAAAAPGYTPFIVPKPANNVSFGSVIASPTAPVSGGSTTLRTTLTDVSGAPVGSADATVALQSSLDNSTWTTVVGAEGIVDSSPGTYTVSVPNITATTYFRFMVSIKNTAQFDPPASASPYSDVVPVTPTNPGGTEQVGRLSGTNRYLTAIAIGQQEYPNWTGVKDVVLASGDNAHLPDALTAAGLAGAYKGPVLLVPVTYLDSDVKHAIQSMPSGVRVHVVGGTPSVSAAVFTKIQALSKVKSIDRISGVNRYATAAAVAARMKSILGGLPHIALITSGGDARLFDPLIASTVSACRHYPVLLVSSTAVPSQTSSALTSLGLNSCYIIGNTAAVSEGVRNALGITPSNRIAGADVFGDAAAFATRARAEGWLTGASVGFAAAVPDAATGGALMGKLGGPMLLVQPAAIPSVTSDFLTANKASITAGGYVFGGTPTIADSVRVALQGLIN